MYRDILSFAFGIISVLFWIICLLPQIINNYYRPELINNTIYMKICKINIPYVQFMWMSGDLLNLIGVLLVDGQPFQKITSYIFVIMDIINFFQKIYYKNMYKFSDISNAEIVDAEIVDAEIVDAEIAGPVPIPSEDIEINVNRYLNISRIPRSLISKFIVILLLGNSATDTVSAQHINNIGIKHIYIANILTDPQNTNFQNEDTKYIGIALGLCATVIYIGSRITIIIKLCNNTLENFDGSMLFYAILGNFFYSLSIIIQTDNREDLITSLPWICGSLTTMLLDIFIVSST